MKVKRKKVESYLLTILKDLDPSGKNVAMYKEIFSKMSDTEFSRMMERIKEGESILSIVTPNGDNSMDMNVARLLKVAKKHNVKLFERVTFDDGNMKFKPDIKYMVVDIPVRRTSQHGLKGLSVAKHYRSRNAITGQVSGKDSDSGSITLPEVYILNGREQKQTLKELLGTRGGDVKASAALNAILFKDGKVSRKEIERFADQTGSTKALKAFFKGMHLDINL